MPDLLDHIERIRVEIQGAALWALAATFACEYLSDEWNDCASALATIDAEDTTVEIWCRSCTARAVLEGVPDA